MSILYKNQDFTILSHEHYVERIYCNTQHVSNCVNLKFNSDLFNIVNPYVHDSQFHNSISQDRLGTKNFKKRKKNRSRTSTADCVDSTVEVNFIKDQFVLMMEHDTFKLIFNLEPGYAITKNNFEARNASKCHFESITSGSGGAFSGKNENEYPVVATIYEKEHIIPAACHFFNCDVLDLSKKLSTSEKFDFILMDPPWRNKYIRRKRKRNEDDGYKMMYDSEIRSIPIDNLMADNGLIAVWCTNSPSHINTLLREIFPTWNIQYISTWFWIKVTKRGELVCNFSEPPGKQPYERIVFGCHSGRSDFYKKPEDKKIIASVPSAIHSHKPPIVELMTEYLATEPKCLELFARYLLPGWVSCGDQVLTLQNFNLYSIKPS